MKKLRKVVTKKGKVAKAIKKQLVEQASMMLHQAKECCVCKTPFERSHETVTTWHVTVIQEKKTVRLTCPTCWGAIKEMVECQE